VAKHATLRVLMALVASEGLHVHQLDVKTAFLNGELEEDIWIQQPPGFGAGSNAFALRLLKALYGLKQASRAWHKMVRELLISMGFAESDADPGLFVRGSCDDRVFVLVYVDDFLVAGKRLAAVRSVMGQLMSAFECTDMGEVSTFIGIDVQHDRAAGTVRLSQQRMAEELVQRFEMWDAKPKSVPINHGTVISTHGEPAAVPYGELVGSLNYLATCTRPDLAHAVGMLARYMSAPTDAHWAMAKGVLRYLRGTTALGIMYSRDACTGGVLGYCDADYAGDLDTRRSTTGYVFVMAGGAVSWSSKRQKTVALSTAEAEYQAAAAATKEAVWLRKLMGDLGRPAGCVPVRSDNQAALALIANPIISARSKHIDVLHHFSRERVLLGEVSFSYISTDLMIADSLTKAMERRKFDFCRKGMGMA
jgi:hypothetical protein